MNFSIYEFKGLSASESESESELKPLTEETIQEIERGDALEIFLIRPNSIQSNEEK